MQKQLDFHDQSEKVRDLWFHLILDRSLWLVNKTDAGPLMSHCIKSPFKEHPSIWVCLSALNKIHMAKCKQMHVVNTHKCIDMHAGHTSYTSIGFLPNVHSYLKKYKNQY